MRRREGRGVMTICRGLVEGKGGGDREEKKERGQPERRCKVAFLTYFFLLLFSLV